MSTFGVFLFTGSSVALLSSGKIQKIEQKCFAPQTLLFPYDKAAQPAAREVVSFSPRRNKFVSRLF